MIAPYTALLEANARFWDAIRRESEAATAGEPYLRAVAHQDAVEANAECKTWLEIYKREAV